MRKFASFTYMYIFALSLIGLLALGSYLNLERLIDAQSNDAEAINISGKQRLLSQRILYYTVTKDCKNLSRSADEMERMHKKLLSLPMEENVHALYFKKPVMLDKQIEEYLALVREYVKTKGGALSKKILKEGSQLQRKLDEAVSLYQKNAEEKVRRLHTFEFVIFVATIISLVLVAFFIFRPLNNAIKKKTKELLEAKEYSDIITQINTNAIIAVNENLEILTYNKSAQKMFGYTAKEMLFTRLVDDRIIPKKYLQAHIEGFENFVKNGRLKHTDEVFELEGRKKDGSEFPIKVSFGTKVDRNKTVVVANIQDMTKEKENENLLLQQSRFAAMGEMIANIAHQWRQPLSSISTLASGARLRYKSGLLSSEELDEIFVKIKEYTQFLSKTIDDFRNFYSDKKSIERFFISQSLNQATSLVKAAYKDNEIELYVDIEEDTTHYGSKSELTQVFLNILNNAKDVLVERDAKERVVLVKVERIGESACVKIADSGGGIPKEVALKIFEPYFTTKHKSQGTGIGLFMSKRIVEHSFKGSVRATNESFELDGKEYYGAVFLVEVPVA